MERLIFSSLLLFSSCIARGLDYVALKQTLLTYQQLNPGTSLQEIPYNYVVPASTSYPKGIQGLKLGQLVSRIRSRGDYMRNEAQRAELEAMGFTPNQKKTKIDIEFDKIIYALKQFQKMEGHLDVPNSFVCEGDHWPNTLKGYNLGSRVHSIRYQGAYSTKIMKERLATVGFEANKRSRRRYGGPLVLSALRAFKQIHGNLRVPFNFVVPGNGEYDNYSDVDGSYPPATHGMKLGHVVMHIRNRGQYEDYRDQLDALGFEWAVWRDKEFVSILEQLAIHELETFDEVSMDTLARLMDMGLGSDADDDDSQQN